MPPHLRGPQASPAPAPETHYGRWILIAAAALALGVGAFIVLGGEEEPPVAAGQRGAPAGAPNPNTNPALAPNPNPGMTAKPASSSAERDAARAQQWEAIALVLGELERHVNRAKLQFGDLPNLTPPAPEPVPEPNPDQVPEPTPQADAGNEVDAGEALRDPELPSPRRVAQVDPALAAQAAEQWTSWQSEWRADLDYALERMPPRGNLNPTLAAAYDAVSNLVASARALPPGNPPDANARQNWLDGIQNQVRNARQLVDAARG